jgi:putative transposase
MFLVAISGHALHFVWRIYGKRLPMADNPPIEIEHIPYRVIQRVSRRQQMFFEDADYQTYLELLARSCQEVGTQVLGYCLLPNQAHLLMVPNRPGGLRGVMSKTHRLYKRRLDFRKGPSKRSFQEFLLSFPVRNEHLLAAVRFIENEPVRAKRVQSAADYPWSSARAHLAGRDDLLVTVGPLLKSCPDWEDFLAHKEESRMFRRFRSQERRGRLVKNFGFTALLGKISGKKKRSARSGFVRQEKRKYD